MEQYDTKKFNFKELVTNTNGKTSGSGMLGMIMGIIGCISFLACMFGYFLEIPETIEVMRQTSFFIGSATVLLGVRKYTGNKNNRNKPEQPFDWDAIPIPEYMECIPNILLQRAEYLE